MSDYMKEAERLIEEYGNAEWKVGKMSEHSDDAEEIVTRENARAALLAHIQRGAPEGWKEATIAWEVCASIHREYAKKKDPFFTTRQADFVRHTEAARATAAKEYTAMLAAAPAPACTAPAPAEVPMPEPVAYLYTLEYGETVVGRRLSEHPLNYPFGICGSDYLEHTDDGESYVRQTPLYTKDAEAAGYERGRAEAGRDAERLDCIERNARCDPKMDGQHVWWPTNFSHRLIGPTLRDAIDAALRGEVK